MRFFLFAGGLSFHGYIFHRFRNIVCRKLVDNVFCTVNHKFRNPCQFSNLYSITFVCAALYNLAQKDDVVTFFLDRNTVIIDTV